MRPSKRLEYVLTRKDTEQVKDRVKTEAWKNLRERLTETVYGLAKSYRKSKAKQWDMKGKEGTVHTEQEDIDSRWAEYFKEPLNARNGEQWQDLEEDIGEEEQDEITKEKFDWTRKEMKKIYHKRNR